MLEAKGYKTLLEVISNRTRGKEKLEPFRYTASVPRLAEVMLSTRNYFELTIKTLSDFRMVLEDIELPGFSRFCSDRLEIVGTFLNISRFAAAYRICLEMGNATYKDDDLKKLNARLAGTSFEKMHLHDLFPSYNRHGFNPPLFPLIICHVMDVKVQDDLDFVRKIYNGDSIYDKVGSYTGIFGDLVAALELREKYPDMALREILS